MRKISPSKKGKKRGRKIPLFFTFLACLGIVLAIILYLQVSQPPPSFTEKARTLDQLLNTQLSQLKVPYGAIHKEEEEHRRGGKAWTLSRWEVTLPAGVTPKEASFQLLQRIQDACPGVSCAEARTQDDAWEIEVKIDNLLTHHVILRPPSIQPPPPISLRPRNPRIAIVVDDLGADKRAAEDLLRLDIPLTFAILPLQPSSRRIAYRAHAEGREIILHLPMEPHGYPLKNPGKGALFVSMDERELLRQMRKNFEAVPFITGVNNHMGSKFMEHGDKVRLVLSELKRRDLFFLDSRTTSKTQGYPIAHDLALKTDTRDLFLDNESDVGYTMLQLEQLIRIARDHGTAIGICHPYPSTITALEEMIPQIHAEGIEIVPLSQAFDE